MRSAVLLALVACSAPARVPARLPDPSPPTFRLPGDVRPDRYRLELTIVPDHPLATGNIHIDATVVRPARVVWLNARELKLHGASLDGQPARVIAGGDDFVGLAADRELSPGP